MCQHRRIDKCKDTCYASALVKPDSNGYYMLRRNKKMKNSVTYNGQSYRVFNYSIPALKDPITRVVTCPSAGRCAQEGGCYALQGAYRWSPTLKAHSRNLQQYKSDVNLWVKLMHADINRAKELAAKANLKLAIRIHDSGDFFDLVYLEIWNHIANEHPDVLFYAYTKQVHYFVGNDRQRDWWRDEGAINVSFSEGGKHDEYHRNARPNTHNIVRVYKTQADLEAAGALNATDNDLVTARNYGKLIGLVYHGADSKEWSTNDDEVCGKVS